ncbi:YhjD/YihY/BrkB family envelope integrity protein [Sphingomonas sp. PB4P5]|uniref:YhjD/YihY/BrkB family envelope integrity protein n=1 Tax=Parasphingomonas puruogangriensis TaxID=3096155 RepID=UPI002FC594F2
MDDQGHEATSPWQMPLAGWIAVAKRSWAETSRDNIGLIAAGVAFYGFLALVPLLGAIVLVYGLAAEPATVMRDMTQLTSVMPTDVAKLIGEQLMNVVETSDGKKGFGLLLALGLALFGARNGAGAVITALNIAYEEEEKRGFVSVNLLALGMTAAAVVVAMLALVAIAVLGYLESLIPGAPGFVLVAGKLAAYALLLLAGAAAAATLYRYGPSRQRARWVWLTPGSLFAALAGLILTIGFGIYVANFGNYNATYGSLGAVVVTLTWLYLSSYILLFGAELNAELEHQTAEDTTKADAPLGERGAWVADHVAGDAAGEPAAPAAPAPAPAAAGGGGYGLNNVVASRAVARSGGLVGLPKVGFTASAAATIGLSLLRRGKGLQGLGLLGATAAIMWLKRERMQFGDQQIKAVFFDVDGTLVDSNEHHVTAWYDAFRAQDIVVPRAKIRGQIGKGADTLVPTLRPDTSTHMRKKLADAHGDLFKSAHLDQVQPFPGAAALLRRVQDSGRRVVLASSADGKEVAHHVARLEVDDVVDAITTSDDAATSKPAGDIFAAALGKVKPLTADEVIVVGDTPYDVEAAAKCGIRTVAVRSGGFPDDVLLNAGAIALYDDVADLLAQFDRSPLSD